MIHESEARWSTALPCEPGWYLWRADGAAGPMARYLVIVQRARTQPAWPGDQQPRILWHDKDSDHLRCANVSGAPKVERQGGWWIRIPDELWGVTDEARATLQGGE